MGQWEVVIVQLDKRLLPAKKGSQESGIGCYFRSTDGCPPVRVVQAKKNGLGYVSGLRDEDRPICTGEELRPVGSVADVQAFVSTFLEGYADVASLQVLRKKPKTVFSRIRSLKGKKRPREGSAVSFEDSDADESLPGGLEEWSWRAEHGVVGPFALPAQPGDDPSTRRYRTTYPYAIVTSYGDPDEEAFAQRGQGRAASLGHIDLHLLSDCRRCKAAPAPRAACQGKKISIDSVLGPLAAEDAGGELATLRATFQAMMAERAEGRAGRSQAGTSNSQVYTSFITEGAPLEEDEEDGDWSGYCHHMEALFRLRPKSEDLGPGKEPGSRRKRIYLPRMCVTGLGPLQKDYPPEDCGMEIVNDVTGDGFRVSESTKCPNCRSK